MHVIDVNDYEVGKTKDNSSSSSADEDEEILIIQFIFVQNGNRPALYFFPYEKSR